MSIVEKFGTDGFPYGRLPGSDSIGPRLVHDNMSATIGTVLGIVSSILVGVCAILASHFVGYLSPEMPVSDQVYLFLFPATLGGLLFYVFSYSNDHLCSFDLQNKLPDFSRVTAWLSATFLALFAGGFTFQVVDNYSSIWFGLWFAFSFTGIVSLHSASSLLVQYMAGKGAFNTRVAILVSDLEIGEKIKLSLMQENHFKENISIFSSGEIDLVMSKGQACELDQIIIGLTRAEEPELLNAIGQLEILPIDLIVCQYSERACFPFKRYGKIGDLELHLIHAKPLTDWKKIQKTVLDYVVATVSLFIFAPVMLLIAIAIKMDSPGPVFFRQKRHGYNHQQISVFKFRTMTVMEDGDVIKQAQKNDSRVTWVGSFLRKTSLDELPQLINILKGEMSVVGPRPHALAHNYEYSELIEKYSNRHKVKPGITGWAQINGFRGPTVNLEDMRKRAELDLEYIDNWSIWLDIKILAMTPIYGFIGRNAF